MEWSLKDGNASMCDKDMEITWLFGEKLDVTAGHGSRYLGCPSRSKH